VVHNVLRKLGPLALVVVVTGCSLGDPEIVEVDLGAADAEVKALIGDLVGKVQAAPTSASLRGRLGMAYEVNSFADAALTSYQQAEAMDAADPTWPYYQALLVAHRGDLAGALDHLGRSMALDPEYFPAWLWQGQWLIDLGGLAEAEQSFEQALTLGAGTPAMVGQARVALAEGDAARALELLLPIAEDKPHPYVFNLVGQAYQQLGQLEDARLALAKVDAPGALTWPDERSQAKQQFEVSLSARVAKARSLIREGRAMTAVSELEELRLRYPDHVGLLTTLSEAYRQSDRPGAALDLLRESIESHPDVNAFRLSLADLYITAGQGDRAYPHLQKAAEINPEIAWVHAQVGLILLDRGDLPVAIEAFEKALELEPEAPAINYYAGESEAAHQQFVEAEEYFTNAIANEPQFTLAYISLGRTQTELGKYDEARAALTRATELATHPDEARSALDALERREAESK
jgi:tetratricopeptide (TPR) repeat protein